MSDNRKTLNAWLARLGWSQRYCADWLTARGSPVSVSTIERWLANPDKRYSQDCPSWPATLIKQAHHRREPMRTITLANQKGGVGKSTIACHLALDLFERGYSVLFIDLDTQGNSTKTLAEHDSGIKASELFNTDLKLDREGEFLLVGADPGLVSLDRADYSVIGHLRGQLDACRDRFDYCIIDTPPTIGLRLSAALIVSDYVLSPIELEQYSIDGIERMLKTIFGVQQRANKNLQFLGMIPNRFDPRSGRQKETLRALVENYSQYLIPEPIGIRASIPEALSEGIPVWKLGKTSARDAGKQIRSAFAAVYEKMGVTHE